ncbi:hypothetical protein BZG36_05038 [Bifiguratus adelaidae]|uniref:Oxysterol-binding protein n=1 Tax=Bifiguratus adelaidae TaxID=1938954 RepID=A0A261XU93_9FUNG|nr:hypothetical protein BZG36_05038 [Bifiguratus adelaidae]
MADEQLEANVPQEQQGAFRSFLKTVATFSGDLSNLTCPSFLLAPTSLLEYSSYWCDHPELFAAITEPEDPLERMLACVKWFISSLNGSYSSRVSSAKNEYEKKPFNPVLGEVFYCSWADVEGCGETSLVCEQVSHHPPISGFYLQNKSKGVYCSGYNGQQSRFSATNINIDQVGHALVHLTNRNDESYLITLPSLQIQGLWYGAPYVELLGNSIIQSSSGYHAYIEYTGRGWVSGEKHHFKATIQNNADYDASIGHKHARGDTWVVEGQWVGVSNLTKPGSKTAEHFYDAAYAPPAERIVPPLEEQEPLESRKLWHPVASALRAYDYETASREKAKIENAQRAERKEREEKGEKWEPRYFTYIENDEEYARLHGMDVKDKHPDLDDAVWVAKEFIQLRTGGDEID